MSDSADEDISREIARIEAEIERLAEALERCRKIALMAKIAMAVGGIGLVVLFGRLVRFDLMGLMAAITSVLGGLVVFGSNEGTQQQTLQALRDAEAERAALIGGIDLRLVEDARGGVPHQRLERGAAAP